MKYLTVEERLAQELIGPWHAVADELQMTPDEYKDALTALFQSEDDAGVQMRWGEINLSGNYITFTFEYSDTTLNSEFDLPALPSGWNYRLLEGNVKRHQRVPGVPMLYDWNLLCFYRGVLINSPNSEYVYKTFRSLRTARVYIKKERRNGR